MVYNVPDILWLFMAFSIILPRYVLNRPVHGVAGGLTSTEKTAVQIMILARSGLLRQFASFHARVLYVLVDNYRYNRQRP